MVTYFGPMNDDRVFKALADATRRYLLDLLFARDGRTLTELESQLAMTRFGVMKHLRVLEAAGLVVTRWSGREKLHFLNPVPIRLIHDRWIHKYAERQVSALAELKDGTGGKGMSAETKASVATTQVYEVYIRATPQAIWDAITSPEWTVKYAYRGAVEYELRPGGAYRAHSDSRDADVRPAGRRRRWRGRGSRPAEKAGAHLSLPVQRRQKAEGFTRVTWEIEKVAAGFSRLTVIHELEGAPIMAGMVASKFSEQGTGGWAWILSDMKSLLETGSSM